MGLSRRPIVVVRAEQQPETQEKQAVKAPDTAPSNGKDEPLNEMSLLKLKQSQRKPHELEWPQKRPFLDMVWDNVIESAEDVGSHLKRSIKKLPTTKAFDKMVGKGEEGRLRLQATKPVVLVLGSGWGAHSLMKVIDTDVYEVVTVSPRNHFVFTPMLPGSAVGTVEFRSLLEPVRTSNPFVNYFEAACDRVDTDNKVAYCTSKNAYLDGRRPAFEVPYDILVVSIGERPATFGTPGVEEHCFFMKEVSDTVGLHQSIQQQFELASLPGTSEADMAQVLHFVVVGGGPTGVEFSGTLSDFLRQDLKKKYPELMPFVRVTLLNSGAILNQFDTKMQQHALDNFKRVGVEVRTGVRVTEVSKDTIMLSTGEVMKYGVCVWSAGNAPRPLVQQLAAQIPEQVELQPGGKPSKLVIDPWLRVIGARDVMAIGDCTLMQGDRLPATAQVAGQQGAYAAHMINRGYLPLQGGMDQPPPCKPVGKIGALEGAYATMGSTMEGSADEEHEGMIYYSKPFSFLNLGMLAYVGNDRALTEIALPFTTIKLSGQFAFLVWKSVYITKQVSLRNRVLILFDWVKAQVFGRDLSNF